MSKLNMSTWIHAPVEQVFEVFAAFEKAQETIDGIVRVEMLTHGPVGVGTRFKETRIMFGREATEEMQVTRFEPNRSYTVSAESCGARYDSTFHFSSQDGGTQVDAEITINALTLFAKLMSPLSLVTSSAMKKMIMDDIQQLKAACENALGQGTPVASA